MPPARVAADFGGLLRALRGGGVDFIVVEGVAGAAHGLARATYDLDIVYARSASNLARLVAAIGGLWRHMPVSRTRPAHRVKRAAGRPKDLEAIAELEALKEERDRS